MPDKPLRFVSVLVKDPKDSAKPGACTCWAPTLPPPTPPPVIRSQGFPTVYAAPTAGLISLPHNWSRGKTRPGSDFFLAGLRIRSDTRLATFFFLRLNDTLHATPSHTHAHSPAGTNTQAHRLPHAAHTHPIIPISHLILGGLHCCNVPSLEAQTHSLSRQLWKEKKQQDKTFRSASFRPPFHSSC